MSELGNIGAGAEGAPGGGAGVPRPIDQGQFSNCPEISPAPTTAKELMNEVLLGSYYALEDRVSNHPLPTEEELEIGVFIEEVQPQVRDAIKIMRQKGYDIGNVLDAGYNEDTGTLQQMTLHTPLSIGDRTMLEVNGIIVEDNKITFAPEDPMDIVGIEATWDWLATALEDLGERAEPAAFKNAVAFREAAASNTLLDYYMPQGVFDPIGTKYVSARDSLAYQNELFATLSPDPLSALRELTFVDQYRDLKRRIENSPTATDAEMNMGAYVEELEPQVRDAVMMMRSKGYNTGSSGFWGERHDIQSMDVATPIDANTRAELVKWGVEVTDGTISFRPERSTDLGAIKRTWDLVASILPDLGHHAEPAINGGATEFRYTMRQQTYSDYLESWAWQMGALTGQMNPVSVAMLNEGYSFGVDVYEPARRAQTYFQQAACSSED